LLGRYSPWISTSWPNGEHGISEGEGWERQWGEKGLIYGGEKMDASSWQWSGAFLPSDSRFSHKTDDAPPPSPRTCVSSPSLNPYWKDDKWSLWRFKKIRWQSCALFHKRHSRNSSKTGRNAGSDLEKVEEKGGKAQYLQNK